jgi:hypothetical protein
VHINDLKSQGWTVSEIAAETGFHRTTIAKPSCSAAINAPVS